MESLGILPFGLTPPPVDSITGLAPTISIDQHLVNRSPRSTVGTATNVYTYLRVLYARLVRGETLVVKHQEFVEAAQTLGAPSWRILVRHVLPTSSGPPSPWGRWRPAG
jgi:ABC-type dipeptide/oligopeptide/nickel transport system permease component